MTGSGTRHRRLFKMRYVGALFLTSGYLLLFGSTFTNSAVILLVTLSLGALSLAVGGALWTLAVIADARHHGIL